MENSSGHVSQPSTDSYQSNHPMLTDQESSTERLSPPVIPFPTLRHSTYTASSKDNASIITNYLPNKFSQLHLRPGKGKSDQIRGGGREAFGVGEARMPDACDEDYDGVMPREGGETRPRMRWNRFKWILFLTNLVITTYSLVGLVFCILTWLNVWQDADIMRVGNRPELVFSTIATSIGLFASLIGWPGILLNNRTFLATYTLLLWTSLALLLIPGYITFKRHTFNLEGKINAQWSRALHHQSGRLRIQNLLGCCGYFSPFVEASISQTCYARASLPGCKAPYLEFQQRILQRWYIIVFGLVPVHIGITVAALLCSGHVTYRFGKGMMPRAYRLNMENVAYIMDEYASQIADQFGGSSRASGSRPSSAPNLVDAQPNVPYIPEQPYLPETYQSEPYLFPGSSSSDPGQVYESRGYDQVGVGMALEYESQGRVRGIYPRTD